MSSQNSKRVTVRLKCPNPLFEEWLVSWKEQAAAKESKMQYIFNNALQSLRKYPLPLQSGRDCKILKGFGDRLCKMLDDQLIKHKKLHGTITNNLQPINLDIEDAAAKNSKKLTSTTSKKRGSVTKQYIPQYGSGGYAILITLYKVSLQPDYPGFLNKTQIIEKGKDLVNSSFTKPDPGSRYTAWSSMRTLLTRNLVLKTCHPPKFSLTSEGKILARKLYENSDSSENKISNRDSDEVQMSLKDENSVEYLGGNSTSEDFATSNCSKQNENRNITNNCKVYDVDIPDELTDELLRSSWIPENNTFSVVRNKDLDNMDSAGTSGSKGIEDEISKKILEPINLEWVGTSKQTSNEICLQKFLSSKSLSTREESSQEPISLKGKGKYPKFYSTSSIISTKSTNTSTKHKENTLNRFASSSSITSMTSTISVMETFLMAPDSFDIILYVDNNETSGSSNNQNDETLVSLRNQGIKHEVKDLKIGDFLWICRDRITNKELVLPYIVERKRMDDFAHSIKDKRYHEQKFRLKKSGIENPIYLVESHGKNQHLGLPLQSLYQAASNTAIQENFFIKFTENTKETVDYLVNISRMLVKMFKSKTLASCSKDDIQPVDINDDFVSLLTFKELNQTSVKNKKMRVTDLFVKMLVQIKGMSVERALAITQLYSTPILLKRAYQKNPGSQGEKLLSGVKYGRYGKSIGIVLSKTIYQAFTRAQY